MSISNSWGWDLVLPLLGLRLNLFPGNQDPASHASWPKKKRKENKQMIKTPKTNNKTIKQYSRQIVKLKSIKTKQETLPPKKTKTKIKKSKKI